MRVAFTLDDIPLWPRSHPPNGYSVASIMKNISDALVRNGIRDVYGLAILGRSSSSRNSRLCWTHG
jgi:hypothetical protein